MVLDSQYCWFDTAVLTSGRVPDYNKSPAFRRQ